MIESTDQIHEVAAVKEQYVKSGFLTGEDSDTLGWVEGEVVGFDIDTDQEQLNAIIRLPWGEEHEYGYSLDDITDNKFRQFCSAFDKTVSEFESIEGEKIYLMVRHLKVDEDGELESGTRFNYDSITSGPHYRRQRVGKIVALIAAIVLVVILL